MHFAGVAQENLLSFTGGAPANSVLVAGGAPANNSILNKYKVVSLPYIDWHSVFFIKSRHLWTIPDNALVPNKLYKGYNPEMPNILPTIQ